MKLTKKMRLQLRAILLDLESGLSFVLDADTALMRKHNQSSIDFFSSEYPEWAGQKWAPIVKECGSEFVLAVEAKRKLQRLLEEQTDARD